MIISLSGWAGSGKTTIARELERMLSFTVLSFAEGLKQEVRDFLTKHETEFEERHLTGTTKDKEEILKIKLLWHKGWTFEEMWFWTYFRWDNVFITPRELMQLWGTEFRRQHFGEGYWGDKLQAIIEQHPQKDFVIDDTRFKNEYQRLKDLGALMVRINRWDKPAYNHPSEIDLDTGVTWDAVIENRGTLAELVEQAKGLVG